MMYIRLFIVSLVTHRLKLGGYAALIMPSRIIKIVQTHVQIVIRMMAGGMIGF